MGSRGATISSGSRTHGGTLRGKHHVATRRRGCRPGVDWSTRRGARTNIVVVTATVVAITIRQDARISSRRRQTRRRHLMREKRESTRRQRGGWEYHGRNHRLLRQTTTRDHGRIVVRTRIMVLPRLVLWRRVRGEWAQVRGDEVVV